jgi:hypothetical protein
VANSAFAHPAFLQGLALQAGSGATCAELQQMVETSMAVWPTR